MYRSHLIGFLYLIHFTIARVVPFRFNKKAKKGIQYLQDQSLLGNTPDDVAEWFHSDERISKTVIGDFLGENEK